MSCRLALFAAICAAALTGAPLHADPFKPVQAEKVALGSQAGIAYGAVDPDGHRLVVTLQAAAGATAAAKEPGRGGSMVALQEPLPVQAIEDYSVIYPGRY